MGALYTGLPDTAPSKQEDPDQAHWGLTEELLAQLVEEVSVLVAERRRKEPRVLPRPWQAKTPAAPAAGSFQVTDEGAVQATGLSGLLTATQMRGAVTLGG